MAIQTGRQAKSGTPPPVSRLTQPKWHQAGTRHGVARVHLSLDHTRLQYNCQGQWSETPFLPSPLETRKQSNRVSPFPCHHLLGPPWPCMSLSAHQLPPGTWQNWQSYPLANPVLLQLRLHNNKLSILEMLSFMARFSTLLQQKLSKACFIITTDYELGSR